MQSTLSNITFPCQPQNYLAYLVRSSRSCSCGNFFCWNYTSLDKDHCSEMWAPSLCRASINALQEGICTGEFCFHHSLFFLEKEPTVQLWGKISVFSFVAAKHFFFSLLPNSISIMDNISVSDQPRDPQSSQVLAAVVVALLLNCDLFSSSESFCFPSLLMRPWWLKTPWQPLQQASMVEFYCTLC